VAVLPEPTTTDRFRVVTTLDAARARPSGATRLEAIREAAPRLAEEVRASGRPAAVATVDLVTVPHPTRSALGHATTAPTPIVCLTRRMLVVQWDDADGAARTLLWEPTDHERLEHTPATGRLAGAMRLPERLLATRHGTVPGHLRALGIDPADVDYVAFDHLHGQDPRRLLGTVGPAPDAGSPDAPVEPWLPRAVLLTQRAEWDTLAAPHPLQAPWYQPATFADLPAERVLAIDGDVLLGPGVALVATPGHSPGHHSLVLHTDTGLWVCSANGVAAECWAPGASRLPGVRRWATTWGHEVVPETSTRAEGAQQYDAMVLEAALADTEPSGRFPQVLPSAELTAHRLAPRLAPTHTVGAIAHGTVRGGDVAPGAAAATA
jgi:hypothetical protein